MEELNIYPIKHNLQQDEYEEQLEPCHETPLKGLRNQSIAVKGTIHLHIILKKALYVVKNISNSIWIELRSPKITSKDDMPLQLVGGEG